MRLRERILNLTLPFLVRDQKALDMTVEWLLRNGYPRMASMALTWGPTHSGATVNEKTALLCSTVWACCRLISGCMGVMPCHVYQGDEDDSEKAPKHPLYYVVHDAADTNLSAGAWRNTMQGHCLVWGNAYSQIIRRSGSGEILGFRVMTPDRVRVQAENNGDITYLYSPNQQDERKFKPSEVFHLRGESWDGISGYSIAKLAAESIGIAVSAELFAAMFYGMGGRTPGVLEYPGKFADKNQYDAFREKYDEVYSGQHGWHKTMILEGGMKWTATGTKPSDMQFIETRQWMVSEICRWYGVPPHLVADLSRATNNNIEHLGIEFVQFCLGFWRGRWQDEFNLKCLERGSGYFVRMDPSGLTRGDFQSRMLGFASALQNGVFSVNEVRAIEGFNPIPGGESHHIQLNMQTLPGGPPTAAQISAAAGQGG